MLPCIRNSVYLCVSCLCLFVEALYFFLSCNDIIISINVTGFLLDMCFSFNAFLLLPCHLAKNHLSLTMHINPFFMMTVFVQKCF
ncbi:hypothetical protein CW304_31570 [Bacillus sp. UFRGS-B20]|nr:hypothetical protein CW304_31570 [Bacillus sp. UFRGS-B20]